jgi:hypothetical protein
VWVLVPTVAYGGVSLLGFISRRTPGYLDNPVRQNLFRAGHAHAGALIIRRASGRAAGEREPGQTNYRSSRLTRTVSTTEATTENNTMSRQPSPPPSGRTSTFPKRMPLD